MSYKESIEFTYPIIWRTLAELLRRHHAACALRVYEVLPCNGFYHGLALYAETDNWPGRMLCLFNFNGGFHRFEHFGPPRASDESVGWLRGHYANEYVSVGSKHFVDQVEALLGLPDMSEARLPPTTPPILVARLLAAMVERDAALRPGRVSCGWVENDVAIDGRVFPAIAAQIQRHEGSWEERARTAGRFWQIEGKGSRHLLLDMHGLAHSNLAPATPLDLMDTYKREGRRLAPLVDRLASFLSN